MSLANRITAELRGDRTIWMIIMMLSLFSILAVYSATGAEAWKSRGWQYNHFLVSHVVRLAFGLLLIYLGHLLHYQRYKNFAPYLMLIAIPLLALTLIFGATVNQAARWLVIPGLGISFQTSDFAKIALLVYVAREATRKQEYITSFKEAFMPIIVPVIVTCGLIAPANLSTSLILFVTCVALMFIGRVSLKYIFLLGLLALIVFAILIIIGQFYPDWVRVDTWASRLSEFMTNPDGGWQVQQSKIAIARGGVFGAGPGNSMIRNFLPYAYADFIYSIICEEYGMIGGVVILGLYVLFFRTVKLVTKSPKAFGAFLAIGLSLSMTIQAMANISVATNLVPATGLTLPMVSMGGTSLLFTSISLGMILSVSKYIESIEEG